MADRKIYVYKKQKQPIFGIVKAVLKIFMRKPKFLNENDKIPTDGILLGPHMWKWAPLYISIYYPEKCAIVGAHPMLGNYKDRFHYLRDIYYMQKCHRKKFGATIAAAFESIFSKMFYRGMHLIPSYEDIRLMHTISDIKGNLDNGLPVYLFPENSDNGYQLVMNDFHEGFITIVKFLNKKRGINTPIYPYYVHTKRRYLSIGKPFYISEFEGKSNEEIIEYIKQRINNLNPWVEEDKKLDPLYPKN